MLRMVIAKGTKKREIEAPFSLIASRADFESLVDQIKYRLESDPVWVYGVVTINPATVVHGPEGMQPEAWEHE